MPRRRARTVEDGSKGTEAFRLGRIEAILLRLKSRLEDCRVELLVARATEITVTRGRFAFCTKFWPSGTVH
jgi:hypothetical protein